MSPFGLNASGSGILLAGDRAPDALLRGAAGLPRRLFDLFRGPHWTLVGFMADRDIVAPRAGLHIHRVGPGEELEDRDGHLHAAYGLAPGEWVLVRPDGHVAAILSMKDAAILERFLASAGLPQAARGGLPPDDRISGRCDPTMSDPGDQGDWGVMTRRYRWCRAPKWFSRRRS